MTIEEIRKYQGIFSAATARGTRRHPGTRRSACILSRHPGCLRRRKGHFHLTSIGLIALNIDDVPTMTFPRIPFICLPSLPIFKLQPLQEIAQHLILADPVVFMIRFSKKGADFVLAQS